MSRRKGGFSAKKFGCRRCGKDFDAYPPDDLHNIASIDEKTHKDHIKIDYKCERCGTVNPIYWGRGETVIGVSEFEE